MYIERRLSCACNEHKILYLQNLACLTYEFGCYYLWLLGTCTAIYAQQLTAQQLPDSSLKPPKPKKQRTSFAAGLMDTAEPQEQRSLRKSTLEVSEEFRRRMQEEEELRQLQRSRKSAARKKPVRRLTQKDMLEEAMRTERENLASLEAYTRLEAEKKKVKEKVNIIQGPFVRFHSITMPLVSELPDPSSICTKEDKGNGALCSDSLENTDQPSTENKSDSVSEQSSLPATVLESAEPQKYSRNFLIFTDTLNYPSTYFPTIKPRKPRKRFCPVTGLPAKYMDPLTGTPYATSQAFRIIRNKYVSEGEQKCEKRLLQLSNWLEEKKRKKLEAKAY